MRRTAFRNRCALGGALAALLACLAAPAAAQSARNVLLVINTASQDSVRVGEHYARVRGVDQSQVLRIDVEPKDEVTRPDYDRRIEQPIVGWLGRNAAHDRILFIVLAKGVPLRVAGSDGRQGTVASVDSELALLYRKLTGRPVPPQGQIANPYFLGDAPLTEAKPFTHEAQDIFLVTRLDGFTADDAIALIDRAQKPAREGRVVLDMKAAWTDKGNEWLKEAATRLEAMGLGARVALESTSEVVTNAKGLLGYYSWGSNDPAIKVRTFGLEFLPGAIAGMFVSSDGRTFREPPAAWTIGSWGDRESYFEGSPQSLAGDLIREGVTGVAAHVAEPYLDATIRPHILFPAYFSGFTLAEAYYLAMPYLSWQTIVVGDPLCQIAPLKRPDETHLNPGLDPDTELSRFFSVRRVEAAAGQGKGLNPEALKVALKAEARLARGDREAAEQALVEATELEPRLIAAQFLLASAYEARGEYAKAMDRYRVMLKVDPENAIAMNNLAYALAVREKKPLEALPIAERAYVLSRANPTVADTLAWVHYLLGDVKKAANYVVDALRSNPNNGEIYLHAAVIFAEVGQIDAARKALDRAVELDKALGEREEAAKVRQRLGPNPDPGAAG